MEERSICPQIECVTNVSSCDQINIYAFKSETEEIDYNDSTNFHWKEINSTILSKNLGFYQVFKKLNF